MQRIGSHILNSIKKTVGVGLLSLCVIACVNSGSDKGSYSEQKTVHAADSLVENQLFPLSDEWLGYFKVVHSTSKSKSEVNERCYAALALFYHYQAGQQLPEAIKNGNYILMNAPPKFSEKRRAYLYNDLGICYAMLQNYDSALMCVKLSIPLLEKINDSLTLARSLNALGNIYFLMKDHTEARKYYTKSLQINTRLKSESGIALNLLNIALILEDFSKPDSALLSLRKALPLAIKNDRKKLVTDIANNTGAIYYRKELFDSAYYYYKISTDQKIAADPFTSITVGINMANCNFILGRTGQALDTLAVLFRRSQENGLGDLMAEVARVQAHIYEKKGNLVNALFYERIVSKIKDSLAAETSGKILSKSLEKADATETEYNRQLQNNLALQEVRQSRNLLIYIIVFSVLFSVLIFLAYRKQIRTSRKLSETTADLKEANQNLVKISEIGQNIITHTGHTDIIEHLYVHLQDLIPADVLAIGVYNKKSGLLEFSNAIENREPLPPFFYELTENNSLATLCFNKQEKIVINNLQWEIDLWFEPGTQIVPKAGKLANAMVYLPLSVNDHKIGVFTVQSFTPDVYTDYHVSTLSSIGAYLAIAMQNAVNYESVKQQRDQLDQAIRQLRINEEQLRETNAAKDKFFGIVAHDLKNPFSSILGFSDVLNKDWENFDETTKQTFIKSISLASQSTYRLLENLLMWSRTQTGGLMFNPETIDLSNVALEAIKVVAGQAEAKKIQVVSRIPFNTPVVADENMIQTVFRNLLTNAIKFSHKNGSVVIAASVEKGLCKVSVTDKGIGISKEDQQKLFRIDQSVKRNGTNNETGSGLGLLLCHELIAKHQGRIWVESEPGKGSSFIFVLPLHLKPNETES